MIEAALLSFDDVFASTGMFGIELGPAAHAHDRRRVAMRGYLTGPILSDETHFVLSRSPLPHCPFCSNHNHWPDDAVVVAFDRSAPDLAHEAAEVCIRGTLVVGELHHEAGLTSNVRLLDAVIA